MAKFDVLVALVMKLDIEVEYVSGKANVAADFKSRMPLKQLKRMIDDEAFDMSREVLPTSSATYGQWNYIYTAYDEWK